MSKQFRYHNCSDESKNHYKMWWKFFFILPWTINRTNLWLFLKTCLYFSKSWINFFDPSLLLSTVMVHLNFSILNDKPSLFFAYISMYRYVLGLGIGFLPGRFFLALVQIGKYLQNSMSSSITQKDPIFGGLKKLRKVVWWKLKKVQEIILYSRQAFCKCE